MKTNFYSLVRKLSLGFLSVILLSCSESPADETGGVPADLQVVTNSSVIRADEAADSGDTDHWRCGNDGCTVSGAGNVDGCL